MNELLTSFIKYLKPNVFKFLVFHITIDLRLLDEAYFKSLTTPVNNSVILEYQTIFRNIYGFEMKKKRFGVVSVMIRCVFVKLSTNFTFQLKLSVKKKFFLKVLNVYMTTTVDLTFVLNLPLIQEEFFFFNSGFIYFFFW